MNLCGYLRSQKHLLLSVPRWRKSRHISFFTVSYPFGRILEQGPQKPHTIQLVNSYEGILVLGTLAQCSTNRNDYIKRTKID